MFNQWLALKKLDYDVAFRCLRHRIHSQKNLGTVVSSTLSVVKRIANPCNVQFSKLTERILTNSPKFYINIKPSRMDIVSAIHNVSSTIADQAGKTALMASFLERLSDWVDDSNKSNRRNFSEIASAKKELE